VIGAIICLICALSTSRLQVNCVRFIGLGFFLIFYTCFEIKVLPLFFVFHLIWCVEVVFNSPALLW